MQSLAEAYTCPSKGIGSPTPRYRTPRDRAKEKETTSRLSPWRVLSRVDARSLARCSLCSLARTSTFVRSFVGPLVGFDRRPIGRSIARIHATHLALSIRDKGETTPWLPSKLDKTRQDGTGKGTERNGTERKGTERERRSDRRPPRDGETDLPISGLSVWFRQLRY